MNKNTILVELFYSKNKQEIWKQILELLPGTNIATAISLSNFTDLFPDLNPLECGVAIFGKLKSADYILENNDRIDICRPLIFNYNKSKKSLFNKK